MRKDIFLFPIWEFRAPVIVAIALSFAITSMAQKPKSAAWYFEEADKKILDGKWQEALQYLTECVRLNPIYADAYYSRGNVREQTGDVQGAITDYNIYLDLVPDHYEALFSRAVLHFNLGHDEMSRLDFLRLRKLPPRETTTIFFKQGAFESGADKMFTAQGTGPHIIYNYLGLIYTRQKNYTQSIQYLDSAIQYSKDPEYVINRGLAKEKSDDFNGALIDYRMALQLDPDNSLAKRNISTLTERAKQSPEESNKLLDNAIVNDPHLPYTYAARAFKRAQQKNWKGAIDDYSQAIRIDSTNKDYYYNRGLVRENISDWEGALRDYIQAIALQEDFVKAWLNHGKVLFKLERTQEAIEDYTVAITFQPEYALAYYNRGIAYYKTKKLPEACKDLNEAVRLKHSVDAALLKKACTP